MRKNANQVVKEHELIEARKRLEEAIPLENNKVLKKSSTSKGSCAKLSCRGRGKGVKLWSTRYFNRKSIKY